MQRLSSNLIGIDSGEEVLFSDFEHDGPMWAGEGARSVRKPVVFSEEFVTPPAVTVGLSLWDVSNMAVARMDVKTDAITRAGFTIVFRTWGDSKIARARVSWQAIGELQHPDNWDIY